MNLEQRILKALEFRPLSNQELFDYLDPAPSIKDLEGSLFVLREQKMWINKLPAIGGGCKDCACEVTFKWRLTMTGRKELAKIPEE